MASVHPESYASPMATVEDIAPVTTRTPWSGIMAVVGKPTSDGRYLIPGEFGWRDLPLPFAGSHGKQQESESAGRVESVELIKASEFDKPGWELPADTPDTAEVVWVEGTFDGSPDAVDAMRNLENGAGVSIDFLIERRALIDADTFEEVDPADVMDTEDILGMLFGGTPEGYLDGMGGKVGGLSLATISAFEETTIRVQGNHAIVAAAFPIRFHVETGTVRDSVLTDRPLVASAAPIAPPRAWFFMEEPDQPTPITIEDDGRFYGHMALWNSCHAGRANGVFSECMYAPASPSRYMNFHLGAIRCADGSDVPVGRITIGTGHAPLNMNAAAARAHYDHTGTVVGYARATDGIFGIFICGVLKSDATAEQIRDFRACPPSGDWRAVDGRLEMQAALAVNVPGYVVPRSQLALAASADELSVSALILGPPSSADYEEAAVVEQQLQTHDNVALLFDLTPLDAA